MRHWIIAATSMTLGLHAMAVRAQDAPSPSSPEACVSITSDAQRLACYDRALGRVQPPATAPPPAPAHSAIHAPPPFPQMDRHSLFRLDRQTPVERRSVQAGAAPPKSLLDSRWELSADSKLGTFNVRGYKPVYLLPVFYTTNVNNTPHSPSPGHTADFSQQLEKLEAKFQISFKTKLWQGVFGDKGDLWFGYTQSSRWQVYNGDISRPFRETNYEPEAMLVFDTDYEVLGWKGRLLGVGVNHQSNGRSQPLSRSWNRIIADIGFERPGWTIMFRPWIRIHEPSRLDDNPDIEDYLGRGSVQIVHEAGGNEYSLLLRHSLRSGERSHGAMRFTWSFPIHSKLRGYLQLFHGYGESLIDYNHRATYVGVGVSLLGWY